MTTDAERIAELESEVRRLRAQHANLNRELESLTYAVSHDLRAPLRSLSGFSQALLELPSANLDPKAHHYLSRIQQAGHKLSELIDAMLALSRIARADMQIRDIDFTALCIEVTNSLAAKHANRTVGINIQPAMRAFGDQRMLRALAEHLFDNAWKFTANTNDAKVVVECHANSDADVTYCIRDNGVGFDNTYAEKLFQPFQRLHADPQFQGLGIGLATVQRVVARHNGRIWAESTLGHGTAIYFSLPRK